MGKSTGFIEFERKGNDKIPPNERIKNFDEFYVYNDENARQEQAARCMNCGVPFCGSVIELKGMTTGCPLNNLIQEWNDEIYNGNYSHAISRLLKTSPFPEFTGRVCPALCEKSCINGMYGSAVTIHDNELFLIEEGFKNGDMSPKLPKIRSDKKVAVIGSGPAGLAVAEKLNKRGHNVTVFEKEDRFGGLLMYGIPNMKIEKKIVERRINLMREEGITFVANSDLGKNLSMNDLQESFDVVVLCCGAKKARDIKVTGRKAKGIYFAVDYLTKITKYLINSEKKCPDAKNKNVIIVGGGDTGNDCVATAIRHGAKSVIQLEMMPRPPEERLSSNPWPEWPKVLNTDYGQEEAIEVFGSDPRIYETTVKSISQKDGKISKLTTVRLAFENGKISEIAGSEKELDVDLLLIAAGFTGYEEYIVPDIKIPLKADYSYKTDKDNVFACGDMKRGQSLVVWAIADGIKCAKQVDDYLMGY